MSVTSELPKIEEITLPERWKDLRLFQEDQVTLIADQYGVRDDVLSVCGNPRMELYKLPRMIDTGPFRDKQEGLAATYSGLVRELFLPSGGSLKTFVEELNVYLRTQHERPYHLIVGSVEQPGTEAYPEGYHKLHGLAQLLEIGLTDDNIPFSILLQRDGTPAYQPMSADWKPQHLYR